MNRYVRNMIPRSWRELALDPGSERHVVQLYRDPEFLQDAVASWIHPPLARSGGAVLICAPANARRVREGLAAMGLDPSALEDDGRLLIVDADALMARFIIDGAPRRDLFMSLVRGLITQVRAAPGASSEVRAWGEMVNLLWQRGQRVAARQLEALWNEAIDRHDVRLLCSYQVDNLSPDTHGEVLRDICEGHSHLIPEADYDALDAALAHALVEFYGEQEAGIVRMTLARQRVLATGMPPAQAVLVALAQSDPKTARRVLAATRARLVPKRRA